MGVKGLWSLLDSTGRPVDMESLRGKVLAVDVSIWMNQAVRGVRDRHGNPIKAAHLVTLFHRVCKLLFYGVKPVFVFDGAAPLLKKKTLDARRHRKGDAERDSSRATQRLMKVLLKKRAVGAVLGKESNSVRTVHGAAGRTADDDLFKLPALPRLPRSSSEEEEEEEEVDEVARADPATWRHHLEFEEDPGSVDVDSSDFKALPCEIQHELLTDLREAHKRRRTLFQAMPEESVSFSNYQLAGLLQRSRLSRRIEGLREDMSGSTAAQGHGDLAAAGRHVESQRVVSEATSHYILIQGPREPEAPGAGAAAASPGESGRNVGPSASLGRPAWSPAHEPADEPSPAERPRARTPSETLEGADVIAAETGSAAEEGAAAAKESPGRGAVAVAMGPGPEAVAAVKKPSGEAAARGRPSEHVVVVKEHLDENAVAVAKEEVVVEKKPSDAFAVVKSPYEDVVTVQKCTDAKPVITVTIKDEEVVVKESNLDIEAVAVAKQPSDDARAVVKSLPEDTATIQKATDVKPVTIVTLEDEEVVVTKRSFGDSTVVAENSSKHGAVAVGDTTAEGPVAAEENLGGGAAVAKKSAADESAVAVVRTSATDAVAAETGRAGSAGGRSAPLEGEVAAGDRGPPGPAPGRVAVATAAVSSSDEDEDFLEVSSVSDIGFERDGEDDGEDEEEGEAAEVDDAAGGPSQRDPVTPEEQGPSPRVPARPPSPAFSPMTQEDLENLQYDLSEEEQSLVSERGHQERMATTITEQMCFECQELLRMFGVPYMTAPGEAEAQCAALDLADRTHGTITDDSDIWLFGGRYVYKNFFNQKRDIDFFQLVDIQRHIGLDRTKLVNLAYLMGSDYTDGVAGVGGVTALEVLNEFSGPGIEPLVTLRAWWDEAQENRKLHARPVESKIKHKLRQLALSEGFPNPAVARAYLEPATSTVAGAFSWGQPQLLSIAEFCESRFGWQLKKTEELLQPVIRQLSATQSQSRIDSFFPVVHPEVRNIKSKRLKRAVTSIKRQEAQAAGDGAVPEPGPASTPLTPAGGFVGGSAGAADSARGSNGLSGAPRSGKKRTRGGRAAKSGGTAASPAGKPAAPKRAKRKPRGRDSSSSSSSSSSGDEASCDFITSGRTVTAQSAFGGRGRGRGAGRGGRRARAARRR